MTNRLRRAGGFAAVSTLSLAAPELGQAAAVPFAAVAVLAAFVVDDGPIFELFARPSDRQEGRLNGLAGFSLAAAGLGVFATIPTVPMSESVFAAAVVVVAFGNLGRALLSEVSDEEFLAVAGFVVVGFLAATVAQLVVSAQLAAAIDLPRFAFLAAVAALVSALFRSMLFPHDDPLILLSVGLLLWLFAEIVLSVSPVLVGVGLAITLVLGYVSYALGTASVPGMLTGVLLGLLAVVLGGAGWFLALMAFFAIGGLSSKYRYDEKEARGVAEGNDGARGTGNVLANSTVALVAVLGYAATAHGDVPAWPFALAFAGSVATALGDTLSSEIGGLYDGPRLVTTLERVDPGTDGAVTWQGELAGLTGTAIVAAIAAGSMPLGSDPVAGGAVVFAAGFVGMTVDSVLGAAVEGDVLGNQAVNFCATLSGAIAAVALGFLI
ncbi:MAG: DUF92 domain-containing protein [Haloferacaceae archaeon]